MYPAFKLHVRWSVVPYTDNEEFRDDILDLIYTLESEAGDVAQLMSDPELAGRMGLSESMFNSDTEEIADEIQDLLDEAKTDVNNADSVSGIILSCATVGSIFTGSRLSGDDSDQKERPNVGVEMFSIGANMIETVDEVTGQSNYDYVTDFLDNLERQKAHIDATNVLFEYFLRDRSLATKYVNTLIIEVNRVSENLQEISDSDEPDPNLLEDTYKMFSTIAEETLPPVVSMMRFLEKEQVEFEKVDQMSLSNLISEIKRYPSLADIAGGIDSNLRNSIHHGGRTGGVRRNRIKKSFEFTYQQGPNNLKTEEISYRDFEQVVLESFATLLTFYTFPILIFSFTALVEMEEDS